MKAKVETAKTLPDAFRPAHALDNESDWEGVSVIARGHIGVVRGAVKERGIVRLFVSTQNWSAWLTSSDVEIQ